MKARAVWGALIVAGVGLVAVGAAALAAWWSLGRLLVWPPSPEHEAWALALLALAGWLWGLVVWMGTRASARRRMKALDRQAQVAALTQQPVLTLDVRGRVNWVNAALSQRTDRHGPQAIGRELVQVLGLPEGEARTELEQAVGQGQALALACDGFDLHGNPLAWQVEMQPLRDTRDRWLGAVVLALDGEALARAERERVAQQAQSARLHDELLTQLEAERQRRENEHAAWLQEQARWDAEQHAMARARAEAEAQLDRLHDEVNALHEGLEAAQTGTWQADLRSQQVTMDAAAIRLTGPAAAVVLGGRPVAQWADWLSPDDWALARAQFLGLLAGTATHRDVVLRLRAPGGEEGQAVWIKAAVVAYGADGQAERLAGTVQRVGEAAQGLQTQWQLLRDGEALHGAATFRLEESNLLMQASPQFFHLQGRPAQAGEMGWGQFVHQVADDVQRRRLQNALDDALAEDAQGWDLTLPLRTALGTAVWVRCRAEPRATSDGERAWLGVLQAVPAPGRIDVAEGDAETDAERPTVPDALSDALPDRSPDRLSDPLPDPLPDRAAAQVRLGRHYGTTARLMAPALLALRQELARAPTGAARQVAAQRVAMLARSLGAAPLADGLQAWDGNDAELPEALQAALTTTAQALKGV
ncbi:MAG: hypothetical protein O9335_14125 [Inhella sp.]|uniref:hypothetical protein n=1 Tax=Inhella sp. TaxID=1921806 RepID=UPI0022CC10F2|nr:hypothetical protein [Inhella sp.]MCZ8236283.1 hypothetical protein [Inhella sp.]